MATSNHTPKKVGVQHIALFAILIITLFLLFQFILMPKAVGVFVTYLFSPLGEAKLKNELVRYDGNVWASSSKDNAQKVYAAGAQDPAKEFINKEYIFDISFKTRTMDQHGYIKSPTEWIAKSPALGEHEIILEPWIAFWVLSLAISFVLACLITMILPSSIGYMAQLFEIQIDNTKSKIRLQTGFGDDIVDLLTMPDDKLNEVDLNFVENSFRTVWNRSEGDPTTSNKKPLEFDDVFHDGTDLVEFREHHLYTRIREHYSEFVVKEIEDTKGGLIWRRNHLNFLKGFRLYMSHHFTEKYSNLVQGLAYAGASILIVIVGIRGLKFIPAAKPSLVFFSTFTEFCMLALLAITLMYTEEEERMDRMLKKMEDSNRSQLDALRLQQHDIHQLSNVLVGQSAEIIKQRVESSITEYMTSDDNIKRVVAEEISEKILRGMREAFANPDSQSSLPSNQFKRS